MSAIVNCLDSYERRARFYPVLLVLMPLALGIACWLPRAWEIQGLVGSTLLGIIVAAFLCQIARDQGKNKESRLFAMWGGKPSATALSYARAAFDKETLRRRHSRLRELDPDLKLPSNEAQETADPASALDAYESATQLLISWTRDRSKFRLLFEENVNYGYRRNLWAMKPAGIAASLLGFACGMTRIIVDSASDSDLNITAVAAVGGAAALLVLWILRVTPSWVRVAADAYSMQLVGAIDSGEIRE